MPARRPRLLLAGLAATALCLPPAAHASETLFGQSWPEAGGWGQAWGEDEPAAAPAETGQAAATQAPAPSVQPQATLEPPPRIVASPTAAVAQAAAEPAPAAETPAPVRTRGFKSKAIEGGDQPIQLTADQIVHDRELGIVSAVGRVEIVQADRTMVADSVSYNLKADVVSASGNVTLVEPSGNVLFADYFELTGDFKNGVANEIRVLLSDRSRVAAATAQRVGGDRTDFDKAVYTACEPCKSNPDRTPIWQVKAERVTHNQADQNIEYRDAWVELAGVPVLYTPYLSHPDPSVKRKSGFLVPTAGVNSNVGPSVTIPYFFALRDNEDFTFSPRFVFPKATTTHTPSVEDADKSVLQRVVLAGQHRWNGTSGETRTSASLTADKSTAETRGHVDARGRFDLDQTWRAGYLLQRTSDDTYAQVYGVRMENDRPWLTTRPYLEGFGRRSYALAEGFSFQGQHNTDDPGRSPLVLPHIAYTYIGEPGWHGSYWTANTDMLSYTRDEGADASRLSMQGGWHLPWRTRTGEIYTLHASMRADGYRTGDISGAQDTNAVGRALPQVALDWRYPFASSAGLPQVLEPMAMIAASPNGGNPRTIPNEDSIGFELDEANVLRPNRMVGLDRVEGGLRGGYGVRWVGYPYHGGFIRAQAGQGWRAHEDSDAFNRDSGFSGHFSDFVGRLDFSPSGNVALSNRLRLDKDSLEVRRNESMVSLGPAPLRFDVSYLLVEKSTDDEGLIYPRRQYLSYGISSALSQYWQAQAVASHDLTDQGGPLSWATQLAYNDECFALIGNFRRFYYSGREDLLSGYELTFNFVLKTLGDVPFNVF